jgi:nitronate monooxygenase
MRIERLTRLLGIELPIVQAPMAGAQDETLAIEAARAGALGSIPCAMLGPDQLRAQVSAFRAHGPRALHLNFFCHRAPAVDASIETRWRERLRPYYAELDLDPDVPPAGPARTPFDAASCELVESLRPEVVSFHFGLPSRELLDRVRAIGAKILCSATTVNEARELERAGCDAIIAQGAEAGGHRGMFLTDDVTSQVGTFALVPQIADAVRVPVIAAGGIADARGVAAAIALGAAGVQVGTAYLKCPEARITSLHRAALAEARDDSTQMTNVITGRPARGIVNRIMRELGPIDDEAPAFPRAAIGVAPLRARAEARGAADFSPLWSGQAAALAREVPAFELTRALAEGLRASGLAPATRGR